MPVDRSIDLQMVPRIKMHRNPGEASAAQKLSESLSRRRRWPLGIHINHLPRAIDDHSKLGHLMRAEQAIEMRSANQIDLALVSDLDRNICKCTITHPQRREFANAITLRRSSYTADVRLGLFYPESDPSCARPVDQRIRAAAIDHKCRAT